MTKYTAADFANARFAEHPDGRVIARCAPESDYEWENNNFVLSDEEMANAGWVPVPTKPAITESVKARYLKDEPWGFRWGFCTALAVLDASVIPDPEPTNTERLKELLDHYFNDAADATLSLQKYLNDHGVTAPKENK
ncbi:hypothetical protein [Brevibacterium oceani]|uniref:hypothetical protein n=1 Tax=Brevibacterium oceani TaxID=358099 RepID=UPI0015E6A5E1|nr:hypothetical protein [Brevibacterium oceani]